MEDKVVIVTGSSSGIGEAIAHSFAKLNCRVVVHGTNPDRVQQVARRCKELSPKGLDHLEVVGDVRDANVLSEIVIRGIEQYGRIDVLINNAGLFKFAKVDQENAFNVYSELMKINLDSVVLLTTLAIPHLKESKGCIVNISSNLHAKCMTGASAYSAAKAGLVMFTKCIAVDLAPDIRVNSVSPGPVVSRMQSRFGMEKEAFIESGKRICLVERVGNPEEVARVVTFLASVESGFITGTDIVVDGGSTIKPEAEIVSS